MSNVVESPKTVDEAPDIYAAQDIRGYCVSMKPNAPIAKKCMKKMRNLYEKPKKPRKQKEKDGTKKRVLKKSEEKQNCISENKDADSPPEIEFLGCFPKKPKDKEIEVVYMSRKKLDPKQRQKLREKAMERRKRYREKRIILAKRVETLESENARLQEMVATANKNVEEVLKKTQKPKAKRKKNDK
jgi:hypothetical protein